MHLRGIAHKKKLNMETIMPILVESGVWPISAPHRALLGILHEHRAPHSRPQMTHHAQMNAIKS